FLYFKIALMASFLLNSPFLFLSPFHLTGRKERACEGQISAQLWILNHIDPIRGNVSFLNQIKQTVEQDASAEQAIVEQPEENHVAQEDNFRRSSYKIFSNTYKINKIHNKEIKEIAIIKRC
ncbi:hypothetical protein ACJX0J_027790, partial [Zea mays]